MDPPSNFGDDRHEPKRQQLRLGFDRLFRPPGERPARRSMQRNGSSKAPTSRLCRRKGRDYLFQYITDDVVNYPGFFVDDITIPEIGYSYDAEADNGDWQSEGWLRTDNILKQRWMVQLIEMVNGQDPVITRLPVDENGVGEWSIGDLSRNKEAILAISALAPVTTETAPYEYTISQ